MDREEGFYWVRLANGDVEVAYYDRALGWMFWATDWYTTNEQVTTLGPKLEPPQ